MPVPRGDVSSVGRGGGVSPLPAPVPFLLSAVRPQGLAEWRVRARRVPLEWTVGMGADVEEGGLRQRE